MDFVHEYKSTEKRLPISKMSQFKEDRDDDDGDSEDDYIVPYLHSKIVALLEKIKQPGDFSEHGTMESFVSPGLEVEGIGMIGLPLSETQAQQLKQKCTQAPFGRGEKTILDISVRKTLQLQPSQFKLNDAFQSNTIREIQAKLQQALGIVSRKINLELYKLLLYDEGSFFKKHRDSEKSDGMFATLVVLLPSVYEGGEIVIYHGKEKRSIDLSKQNKYELGWISFYADCKHEVLPLKSGYRLALVYNVCFTHSPTEDESPIPKSIDTSFISKFGSIFEKWNKDPSMIAIKLDHSYSHRSLKIDHLKNGDYSKLIALKSLSKYYPIEVYLVTVKKFTKSDQKTFEVDHWVDCENQVIPFGKVEIQPDSLYPENAFSDLLFYKEREEETGNDGTFMDRWYRFGFVMFWPSCHSAQVFSGAQQSIMSLLSDSIVEAKKICPKFDRTNKKWAQCLHYSRKFKADCPEDSLLVIEFMQIMDSEEDPIGMKNTKIFITERDSIPETNSVFVSKLESLVSKFGGWSQWKETIFALARNLERPWALLVWMLNDCSCARPTFIKTNVEREEIRKHATEIVQSKPIRPPMCLVVSLIGDIPLAKQMIPKLLSAAWRCSIKNFEEARPREMGFSHITSMIQGFGFDQSLCYEVRTFFDKNSIGVNLERATFAVWSMFFQQTSLRRLRIESAKKIVRFGRLIGTNKKLSDRNRAILKLILNEISSSRLSPIELNGLIVGSLKRSNLRFPNVERFFREAPSKFICETFGVQKYTRAVHHRSTGEVDPFIIWDEPKTSLNEDFRNDGPPALGSEARKKFAKSLFRMLYEKSKVEEFPSKHSQEIENLVGLAGRREERNVWCCMFALCCYVEDWKKFADLRSRTRSVYTPRGTIHGGYRRIEKQVEMILVLGDLLKKEFDSLPRKQEEQEEEKKFKD